MKPETLTPETLTLNPERERERDCETALRCRSPRGVVAVIVRELRLWTAVPCLLLRLLHLLFSPRARTPQGRQHHRGCTGAAGSLAVRVRDGDERERERVRQRGRRRVDGRNGEKAVDSEMCILRAAEILESLPAHGRVAR